MFTTLEQNCNQSSRIVNVMLGCTSTLLIYGLLRMKGRSMFSISSKPFSGTDVNLCPKTPRKIDDNDCMLTPCEKRITGVQSVSDIEEKILIAARATAQAYARPASEHALIARLYQKCQDKTDRVELLDALKKAILQRPDLANIRAANMGRYMCDGGTLLHTASRSGNLGAIEFLLQQGSLSPWDIDLQGRLPLHWAAENWHVDACRMLLEAMRTSEKYTHCDFRGVDAPTDLMGLTPLGWACVGSSRRAGQPKPPQELIDLLFAPGDGSIMPPTPYEMRSGSRRIVSPSCTQGSRTCSSVSSAQTAVSRTPKSSGSDFYGSTYAHSGAKGWRDSMEDVIVAACPLKLELSRQWSLFAVLDGHGGKFAAEFVADKIVPILAEELNTAMTRTLESKSEKIRGGGEEVRNLVSMFQSPSALRNSEDVPCPTLEESAPVITGGVLESVLEATCVRVDEELSKHSRMQVHVKQRVFSKEGESTFVLSCDDTSGTTACICLVGPGLVAIGNLGDSRAVIAFEGPGRGRSVIAEDLSEDHQPGISSERSRIEAAGYSVIEGGNNKFSIICPFSEYEPHRLVPSRGFGDFMFKHGPVVRTERLRGEDEELTDAEGAGIDQPPPPTLLPPSKQAVSCVPDVVVRQRSKRDWFIVIACDGIWDVMTNDEVVEFLAVHLGYVSEHDTATVAATTATEHRADMSSGLYEASSEELQFAAAAAGDVLLEECLRRGSTDNMSALVVLLKPPYFSFRSPPPRTVFGGGGVQDGEQLIYGRKISFSVHPPVSADQISPLKPVQMDGIFDD